MSDTQAGFKASAKALNALTNAAENHPEHPQSNLHRPANHESAHSWLAKVIPPEALESLENSFHMGNYVIDRQTGKKTFEAMSLYVRLGMHL
jgi:phosphatidylserine decarboxylase